MKLQENVPVTLTEETIEHLTNELQSFLGGEIVAVSGSDGRWLINNFEQCDDTIMMNFFDDGATQQRFIKPGDIITKVSFRLLTMLTPDGEVAFTRLFPNRYED
jgi:hypothetical protein